jgi:hypothetical protein
MNKMRFKKYIYDSIQRHYDLINKKLFKQYHVKPKDIEVAKKALAKHHKVQEKYMEFAFVWEVLEGVVMLTFNITDENHKNFKSTVNYRWLPIEKRGQF